MVRENVLAARQTIAAPSRRLGGSGSTAGGSGSEEPGIYTLIIYFASYDMLHKKRMSKQFSKVLKHINKFVSS